MRDVALVDLIDRVIDKGVIVAGDVTLSVAQVDLVHVGLRVLLAPVEKLPQLIKTTEQQGVVYVDIQAPGPATS